MAVVYFDEELVDETLDDAASAVDFGLEGGQFWMQSPVVREL